MARRGCGRNRSQGAVGGDPKYPRFDYRTAAVSVHAAQRQEPKPGLDQLPHAGAAVGDHSVVRQFGATDDIDRSRAEARFGADAHAAIGRQRKRQIRAERPPSDHQVVWGCTQAVVVADHQHAFGDRGDSRIGIGTIQGDRAASRLVQPHRSSESCADHSALDLERSRAG